MKTSDSNPHSSFPCSEFKRLEDSLQGIHNELAKKTKKLQSLQLDVAALETSQNDTKTQMIAVQSRNWAHVERKDELIKELKICKQRKALLEQMLENAQIDLANANMAEIHSQSVSFLSHFQDSIHADSTITFEMVQSTSGEVRELLWEHLSKQGFAKNKLCPKKYRSSRRGFEDRLICVRQESKERVLHRITNILELL